MPGWPSTPPPPLAPNIVFTPTYESQVYQCNLVVISRYNMTLPPKGGSTRLYNQF